MTRPFHPSTAPTQSFIWQISIKHVFAIPALAEVTEMSIKHDQPTLGSSPAWPCHQGAPQPGLQTWWVCLVLSRSLCAFFCVWILFHTMLVRFTLFADWSFSYSPACVIFHCPDTPITYFSILLLTTFGLLLLAAWGHSETCCRTHSCSWRWCMAARIFLWISS